ncbi:TetR family transcriptional regulator C-terminal domain-containing protein [Crossiella sp. CA-258035]|uniref:TetR/AcrR family transcriptional regulator n=1 Tax=Crossiella sp. CA-258035 TaxID=2981138 RepID=UPI0024BC1D78|nr:TetR family transcriptional regulator C-terminal domain-containing protein [Crossiella sp. CA-258035]WHT15871.1 TetR family transcriptional regulator C-terminal domain-containing protein [Crossiella sp. CA-258035]
MSNRQNGGRRHDILSATIEHIRTRGIAATRPADIAASLGISTALVFYHFGTIENLIAEAFSAAAEHDLARLAELRAAGNALTRLAAVLRFYAPTGDATGWVLWIEGWAASLHDDNLRKVAQNLDLRWREAVEELINEGVAEGAFVCPDPRGAAWRMTSLLDGLAVQLVARQGTVRPEDLTGWLHEAVARELGISADKLGALV